MAAIGLHDADLKNTSDDAIPNYLNSLKFKQIHTLTDTRLALGYSAFAIAGACFAWDYKFGFESTKYYTAAAVAVYALLNAVLTYWIAYVEKGVVYQGVAPSGDKVRLSYNFIRVRSKTDPSVFRSRYRHQPRRTCPSTTSRSP